ncbi:MAG: hypothetical protein H0V71_11655 [Chloroflexi bacterium]|nr:hypothetical protein [Chloroflexota bacterium]
MIEQLAPVVAVPALVAAGWTMTGLRLMRSPLWATGGIVAAGLAGALVLIAAFLPLLGLIGSLGVPALSVGAGILLMFLFARPQAVAAALAVPFALFVMVQPQWFPLVLPLILVIPLWTVGWLEREGGAARYGLTILAAFLAVPIAVFGAFFLLRGRG